MNRLKYVATLSKEKLNEMPYDSQYLGLEHIESKTGRLLIDTVVENVDSNVSVFKNGDVLFSKLRPYLAKVTYAEFSGVCTTELLVLKPNCRSDGRFLFYLLLSNEFISLVNSMTYGTKMPRANAEQINNIILPLPDVNEQRTIAAFLDRETAKIDALIGKKRRLISLLEGKRAAVISHAVTKGLNPDAPKKDSGVEWLGEIPAGWDIQRLKYICSLLRDGTHLPPPRKTTGYPLLSVRNIVDGNLVNLPDDSFISESDFQQMEKSFSIRRDDILLAIVGATLGKVAIVGEMSPFQIQRSLAIFRPRSEIICFKYLGYFFRGDAFQKVLWKSVGFSAQPGIYLGTLANIHVTIPQIDEQMRIINFLDFKIAKIDTVIQKIHEAINKLQEYRTALISAAVTGKIYVRGTIA